MPKPHTKKNNKSNQNAHIKRLMKTERERVMNGRKLKVPSEPPQFVAVPWHEVTIRSQTNAASFNVFAIITLLRSQLHLTTNQPIDIRIRNVRIWGPLVAFSAGPLGPLRVRVHTLSPTLAPNSVSSPFYALLEDMIDYPDQTRRARIGFEWPESQQSLSLSTIATVDGPPVIEITEGNSPGLLLYFRVWWRPTSGLSLDSLALN